MVRTAIFGALLAFALYTASPFYNQPLNAAAAAAEFQGPDVVIIEGEERTVYEYRQNGQLRMIRIVPKIGKPYYLVPLDQTRNFGNLEQAETLVKQWVLIEF